MSSVLVDLLPAGMFLALIIGLFSGAPVAIMLMGISLVFTILAVSTGVMRPAQISLIPSRVYTGVIENQVLIAAPMFIFMGLILERTRIANDLLLTLQRLLRHVPGGLALAVVAMGTILAAATGIIGASIVMLSLMAIPTMLERGYDKGLAAGTVASAGTLGILIPPSVMLVFMGDLLSVSLGRLFVAALLPGLLLSCFYMIYIVVRAVLQPSVAPKLPPGSLEAQPVRAREALIAVAAPLFLVMAVLGSILGGFATPTEASGVGVAAALILAALRGRLTFSMLRDTQERTVQSVAMLFFIFIGATAFAYVFRVVGGEHFIVDVARSLPLGDWGLLIAIMLMVFLMGLFFDWIEITLILLPIFAPILRLMDLGDHIPQEQIIFWVAILITINLQTSFVTPPFGFALFYMKGSVGNLLSMRDIYSGVVPFIFLQLSVVVLVMLFPQIAMWLPDKVFSR